jgi:hypothetical protein
VRPIAPTSDSRMVAEEQEQYKTLPCATYLDTTAAMWCHTTAWVPSNEELERLAEQLAMAMVATVPGAPPNDTPLPSRYQLMRMLLTAFRAAPVYVEALSLFREVTPLRVNVGRPPWVPE